MQIGLHATHAHMHTLHTLDTPHTSTAGPHTAGAFRQGASSAGAGEAYGAPAAYGAEAAWGVATACGTGAAIPASCSIWRVG
jgi:hypothetical protein